MAPRASSPALSENEFDIADALFGDIEDATTGQEKGQIADLGLDLNLGGDSSDDEAFIAARQAASNRKASNIKGNSVKKGGGFQAMGLNAPLLKSITKKGFTVPVCIRIRGGIFDSRSLHYSLLIRVYLDRLLTLLLLDSHSTENHSPHS